MIISNSKKVSITTSKLTSYLPLNNIEVYFQTLVYKINIYSHLSAFFFLNSNFSIQFIFSASFVNAQNDFSYVIYIHLDFLSQSCLHNNINQSFYVIVDKVNKIVERQIILIKMEIIVILTNFLYLLELFLSY